MVGRSCTGHVGGGIWIVVRVRRNGGWNVISIYSEFNVADFADRGEFFFDNIQMNINPFLSDDDADKS